MAWMYMPPRRPVFGTTTVIGGLPARESLSARALYVHAMRIGVSPEATVAVLPITGTKIPASFSFLKKSRPGWALSTEPPFARAAAQTAETAWFDWVGSPARETVFLPWARRSDQSCGTVLMTEVLTSKDMTP